LEEVKVARANDDPARGPLDAHLAPADDAMDGALVPEVGEIRPERSVALGGELEVERLRE
jgi:hypothetical protein